MNDVKATRPPIKPPAPPSNTNSITALVCRSVARAVYSCSLSARGTSALRHAPLRDSALSAHLQPPQLVATLLQRRHGYREREDCALINAPRRGSESSMPIATNASISRGAEAVGLAPRQTM